MHEIRHGGLLLAVYGNVNDIPDGRFFWGNGEEPIQWGTQSLSEEEVIQAHVHKTRARRFECKTIEAFIVLAGRLLVDIYTADKDWLCDVELKQRSFLVTYDGGHGFTSLENGTKFIEVKLGPFTVVEDDKEKF